MSVSGSEELTINGDYNIKTYLLSLASHNFITFYLVTGEMVSWFVEEKSEEKVRPLISATLFHTRVSLRGRALRRKKLRNNHLAISYFNVNLALSPFVHLETHFVCPSQVV